MQEWQLPALENEVVKELRNIVGEEGQKIQERAKTGASLGKKNPQLEEGHASWRLEVKTGEAKTFKTICSWAYFVRLCYLEWPK